MTIQHNVTNDNVISYDSGDKIFEHDKERGKWSSNWDFLTACIGHSFSVVNFSFIPQMLINEGGVLFIIFYLIGALIFTIPIIFVQSFLGQFSSTGFISAFRIAPMFKGIGYVILCLNLVAACYHSVYAAIPLIYLFTSIGPDLPWMTCTNDWNSKSCIEEKHYTSNISYPVWSTDEFFHKVIVLRGNSYWSISWGLFGTLILTWILLGAIMTTKVKIIGKILRYVTFTMIIVLVVLFLRILCLPNSFSSLLQFLIPKFEKGDSIFNVGTLFLSALSFGYGWGTVLTLASYNDFKINIGRISVMICLSHLIVLLVCGSMHVIIKQYANEIYNISRYTSREHLDVVYTMFPFLLGTLEIPQLWTALFFLILFLGEFSSFVIQILSILTAVFDEFVKSRIYKKQITLGLLSCLAIMSMGYIFRNGFYLVIQVMSLSGASQMLICFIELMIVVWVYGRERFQRDIKFMIGIQYSTWKFYIIRLITPIFVLIACIFYMLNFIFTIIVLPETNLIWLMMSFFMQLLPIIIIPIYIVVRLSITTGNILNRFRRLCRPNDWYPVDPIHRQKYEEFLGNPDITHQLVDMNEFETEDNT